MQNEKKKMSEAAKRRISEQLIKARKKSGMTKTQFAAKIGSEYRRVHEWESKHTFTIDVIYMYAKATGQAISII